MKQEPSPGLLMSMAIRYDHGLAIPGYYDQPIFADSGLSHAQRLRATLGTMRQLWEEVTGNGFYKPGLEDTYVAMMRGFGDSGEDGPDTMYWCEHCRSYHVDPRDESHHAALKCAAPFEPKNS